MGKQQRDWMPQARRGVFEVYRQRGEMTWIEALGDSMRPLIVPGTWLLVEFGAMPIGPGDIVLFLLGELLVVHRVVARCCQQGAMLLITKGDAEPFYDPPLHLVDVIGVVRALRYSPDAPMITIGCRGCSARTIAQISRWSAHRTSLARCAAHLLPNCQRRVAVLPIAPLPRIAAQGLLAPFRWVASIQAVQRLRAERR